MIKTYKLFDPKEHNVHVSRDIEFHQKWNTDMKELQNKGKDKIINEKLIPHHILYQVHLWKKIQYQKKQTRNIQELCKVINHINHVYLYAHEEVISFEDAIKD